MKRKSAGEPLPEKQRLRYRNHAQDKAFYELKTVRPKPGWEVASAGVLIASGEPLLRQGRQVSRGIVLDMETEETAITYNKLRKITGLDITEDNYRSFIPSQELEKFRRLGQRIPVRASKQDCICKDPNRHLDYLYIRTIRAYGADVALFNQYADGYHAFYIANMNGGVFLPMKTKPIPSLEDIDALLDQWPGWDIYDRLLTEEEANWFQNVFFETADDPEDLWNDMYGRTHTDYEYAVNGEKLSFSRNTRFSAEMQKHIGALAKGGIEIQ